jgi:hypothetical protein
VGWFERIGVAARAMPRCRAVTSRIVFAVITVFWVVMNVLLWRTEFGSHQLTSEVPIATVWERILEAPDVSKLIVRHRGQVLGRIDWLPTITENQPANAGSTAVEGRVTAAAGYTVSLAAQFSQAEGALRKVRVRGLAEFSTNRTWTVLSARVDSRPQAWEVTLRSDDPVVRVVMEEGRRRMEHAFNPRDLGATGLLLAPYLPLLPPGLLSPEGGVNSAGLLDRLKWTARNDWLAIGKSRVRVFRVEARFADRFEATAYVSRAGELLRIDLPDGLQLANEVIPNP